MSTSNTQQSGLFQSTPPCGGDWPWRNLRPGWPRFQSTPPCGGDCKIWSLAFLASNFNPRPLAGATSAFVPVLPSRRFQSTPPCGGDDAMDLQRDIQRHFNPRPLAGATRFGCLRHGKDFDFNPRPLAGATLPVPGMHSKHLFQSTPPCGGDFMTLPHTAPTKISIHAPLRGRPRTKRILASRPDFNPRPLAGATVLSNVRIPTIRSFQSTPPCGGDFLLLKRILEIWYFNPRPLAGATRLTDQPRKGSSDFNPRPLAGATG